MTATERATKVLIEPLCEETERLLQPLNFNSHDELYLDLDGRGDFRARITPGDFWKASYQAKKVFPSRIPERHEDGLGEWTFKATDITAIIINALWPPERLHFSPDAKTVFDYLLLRFASQVNRAEMRARWRIEGTAPLLNYHRHPSRSLAEYQEVGLASTLNSEASALFMEQGTGKTAVAVTRICEEAEKLGRPMRVMVVCPKNVRTNWGAELGKFATTEGSYAVLRGGALSRVHQLVELFGNRGEDAKWKVVIASYETVMRSWDILSAIDWDLIILDESHYIKSVYTKRIQKIMELRDLSDRRMILTGTPITNSILDLYAQLEFLGRGLSGFTTWKAFKAFYGRYAPTQHGEKLVGYQNLPILQERLARLAFMVTKAEALPYLPKKLYDVIEVEMTPHQREVYQRVGKELFVEIENALADETNRLTVTNILVKLLRLAQITSGFVRWDGKLEDDDTMTPGRIEFFEQNPKLDALTEIAEQYRTDGKLIVWATFVPDIKAIQKRLAHLNPVTYYGGTKDDEREAAIKAFNTDPTCRVFVGNAAAGGVGINLWGYDADHGSTDVGVKRVVYYSQNWSMVQRSQSEDRSHRRGTKDQVTFTDLVVPGSIDEEIRRRVLDKRITAMEIQDVRAILSKLMDLSVEADDE